MVFLPLQKQNLVRIEAVLPVPKINMIIIWVMTGQSRMTEKKKKKKLNVRIYKLIEESANRTMLLTLPLFTCIATPQGQHT